MDILVKFATVLAIFNIVAEWEGQYIKIAADDLKYGSANQLVVINADNYRRN